MWSILFPINSLDADWLVYELWQQGTTGILEEADGLRAFFEDEVNQRAIQSLLPAASIRCEQDGYAQPAQAVQEPVEAGTRFYCRFCPRSSYHSHRAFAPGLKRFGRFRQRTS